VLTNASEDLPETQFLKLEREQLLDTINDLRRRLDKSEEERRSTQERLALLLEHKPSLTESKPEKKGQNTLWKKIFRS
jgi:chromosome segregation ATPase